MFKRAKRETRPKKKKREKNVFVYGRKAAWKWEADFREKARKGNRSAQGEAKSVVTLERARTSMQPLSSILFQFPVQGDYGVSRGAASRLARVYARERAVACKRALARVCATLIACAAAAQKPNELECLLSCLRSPLCARLPARLSPRVRFETRIKQTALMPDPCRSAPLPPPLLSAARRRR